MGKGAKMKVKEPMTSREFNRITGYAPELDDMERVNCQDAGTTGHQQCGVCEHGYPKFLHCKICAAYMEGLVDGYRKAQKEFIDEYIK